MKYLFKEGESQDLLVTIDIQKENNLYDVVFRFEHENIDYSRTVKLKRNEIADLFKSISSFKKGDINDFFIWDLNSSAFELCFNPDTDTIEFRLFLDPPFTHLSGLFFQMTGKSEYEPFASLLEESLKEGDLSIQ